MVDNTTQDWFGLQGREENGWTAIQFKRLLDTCDIMDYPIKVFLFEYISRIMMMDLYCSQEQIL
jgi:hypothetical protein